MAASDLERLVVSMEARSTAFERALSKALSDTNKNASGIERRVTAMQKRVESSFSGLQRVSGAIGFAGGTAGATAALGALVKATDAYREMRNSLSVAGLEGAELDAVMSKLTTSAKANFAPVGSLVTLYGRAAQASKELGASQADLLSFTDNVAKALRVAGSSPEAASGALLQLSQLLGSARVQAEEFNSVNEGARPILQAVADGLVEAGGSVSKLKQLVNDGEVSNTAFFRAFQVGAQGLDAKLKNTEVTVSGALTNLRTEIIETAGRFDRGAKSTDAFVGAIEDVRKAIQDTANFFEQAAGPLQKVGAGLEWVKEKLDAAAVSAGRLSGFDNVGHAIDQALGRRDDTQMSDTLDTTAKSAEALEEKARRLTQEIERLSSNRLTMDTSRLKEAREELEKVRVALEAAAAAKARLYGDPAGAIIAATPVDTPPAPTSAEIERLIAGGQSNAKPVSTADFPVQADADKAAERASIAIGSKIVSIIERLESGGNPNAKNDMSSASGVGQFTDSTFVAEFRKEFKTQAKGLSDGAILAFKNNADIQRRLIGSYAEANAMTLAKAGQAVTAANVYLAHFLGPGGALKILQANPGASARSVLGDKAANANPTILGGGRTAGDVIAWAGRKTDGARRDLGDLTPGEKQAKSFEETLRDSDARVAALKREGETLGQNAYQIAYATEKARLLNEVERDGAKATETEIEQIDRKAAAYAEASTNVDNMRKSAEGLKDAQEFFAEGATDAFTGIVTGAKTAKEALRDLASSFAQAGIKALLMGQGPLAGLFGTANPKGGLGGLFGGLFGFADGGVMTPSGPRHLARYAGGGVSDKAAIFGEAGPEAAVPLPDGRRIPVNLRVPKIGTNRPIPRASNTLNLRTTIDLTGANGDETIRRIAKEQAEAGVASGLRAYDRNFKNRVDYMQTHEI